VPKRQEALNAWVEILMERLIWLDANIEGALEAGASKPAGADACDMLINHQVRLYRMLKACNDLSCRIRCGAICCHFPKDGLSVQLETEVVEKIGGWLRGQGQSLSGFVRQTKHSILPEEYAKALSGGGFVFSRDGVDYVYEVDTANGLLPSRLLMNLPQCGDGRHLWVDGRCAPCAFLNGQMRCRLYMVGIRPGICDRFVCSAKMALDVVIQFGYLRRDSLDGLDFPQLNRLADKVLDVFDDGFIEAETVYQTAASLLCAAVLSKEDADVAADAYKAQEKKYLSWRRGLFGRALGGFFEGI
jgi:hypothetical protein